nr:MAG TPA: hypothetical protein [Caudoviricetes sp.]DAR57041.1 MAG TPA: hypothetical protein [Caudoviricetes sp.]DAY98072.1 MAG TPA: hypothetical protein [Caudoviricetes sp.]
MQLLITSYREYLSIDFGCRLMPLLHRGAG